MTLDELTADVEATYADLTAREDLELPDGALRELTMLSAALDEEPDDVLVRAINLLFQSTVDTGRMDFHLRSTYDVTYDEYLSGMTYEEMTQDAAPPPRPADDRRYQF